jgi:hypothetical protein
VQTATLTRLIRGNDGKAHLPGEILTIRSAVTQQLGEDRAILQIQPLHYASRRNESPIAQSRWPRWAIRRSTGF